MCTQLDDRIFDISQIYVQLYYVIALSRIAHRIYLSFLFLFELFVIFNIIHIHFFTTHAFSIIYFDLIFLLFQLRVVWSLIMLNLSNWLFI